MSLSEGSIRAKAAEVKFAEFQFDRIDSEKVKEAALELTTMRAFLFACDKSKSRDFLLEKVDSALDALGILNIVKQLHGGVLESRGIDW